VTENETALEHTSEQLQDEQTKPEPDWLRRNWVAVTSVVVAVVLGIVLAVVLVTRSSPDEEAAADACPPVRGHGQRLPRAR